MALPTTESDADRRKSPRSLHDEVIIAKVVASSEPGIAPGRTFVAKMADVSVTGMRVRLNHEPTVGSSVDLWVVSSRHPGTLLLNGTVRWARPVALEGYTHQAGIELSTNPPEALALWQLMVKDLTPGAGR
jgi:hypothetical protein